LSTYNEITPNTKTIQLDALPYKSLIKQLTETIIHWNLNVVYSNDKTKKKEFKNTNKGNSNDFLMDILEELSLKENFIQKISKKIFVDLIRGKL
jgi:hypothetical protein